jgi:hypothetical protein
MAHSRKGGREKRREGGREGKEKKKSIRELWQNMQKPNLHVILKDRKRALFL